jgi:hypothetical protein
MTTNEIAIAVVAVPAFGVGWRLGSAVVKELWAPSWTGKSKGRRDVFLLAIATVLALSAIVLLPALGNALG